MKQEIFTLQEVADYLKVTARTIYRLLNDSELPGFKLGGAWRFRKTELDRWIGQQTRGQAKAVRTLDHSDAEQKNEAR